MQYLRSEVGQLGGLLKADRLHPQRIRADTRIGGHDAVHVRPYLNRLGMHAATDQGSGKVRAAASQRRCRAFFR